MLLKEKEPKIKKQTSINGAEVEEATEGWTIISYIELIAEKGKALDVVRGDALQKVHVVH